jgi:Uma2 family endonuclease
MNLALNPTIENPSRRTFTVEDIRLMIEAGVLREDERIELVEGELIMMSAKKVAHELIKSELLGALARAVPNDMYVGVESTVQLADDILLEPDIVVISRDVYKADPKSFARPRAQDLLVVIEIAVSSLVYDRGIKARLYAQHGIREFWVIDANERVTWIHTLPDADGWSSIVKRGSDELLTLPALPGFSIRLADI